MSRAGLIGCVVASALVASGCTYSTVPATPPQGRGPITFTEGQDTTHGAKIRELVDRWNRSARGEKEPVNFIELSSSTDEHRAELLARAQDMAGARGEQSYQSQCYDIVTLDVIWTAEFAHAGYIKPLEPTEFDLDAFLPRPVDGAMFEGKLWAIPARTDAALLYYRKDILDAELKTPPTSWAELESRAKEIAPKHGMKGHVGQFTRYEGFTVNALEAIWASGGNVVSDESDIVIGSAQAKAGIEVLANGFRDGWIPPEAIHYDEESSRETFQNGTALFMRNWPYAHRVLAAPDSPVAGKFEVTAPPWRSAIGGWNLAISQCSVNLRTAYDFIKYFTDEEQQRFLFESAGLAPSRAAPYDDPELRRRFPYLGALRQSLEKAVNRPVTPYYYQMSSLIQEHLQPVLDNQGSLDSVMDGLAEELEAVQEGRHPPG